MNENDREYAVELGYSNRTQERALEEPVDQRATQGRAAEQAAALQAGLGRAGEEEEEEEEEEGSGRPATVSEWCGGGLATAWAAVTWLGMAECE